MTAIDYMTRFEEDGLQLYELLGFTSQNQELKNTFNLLADSQRRHLTTLLSMKNEVQSTIGESELLGRTTVLTNGFQRLLESHDIQRELKNDPEAFWHILRTEQECIKLMEGVAHAEPEESNRTLLNRLIVEEKEHLEKIENIYEFITTPRSFLEWGEFSNTRQL
jgi:rubrerythrin